MLQSVDTNPYIFTQVNDVVYVGCWQSEIFMSNAEVATSKGGVKE